MIFSVKPTLKKVSKYDNKFKSAGKAEGEKADFRSNLKVVKKESAVEDLMAKVIFENLIQPYLRLFFSVQVCYQFFFLILK